MLPVLWDSICANFKQPNWRHIIFKPDNLIWNNLFKYVILWRVWFLLYWNMNENLWAPVTSAECCRVYCCGSCCTLLGHLCSAVRGMFCLLVTRQHENTRLSCVKLAILTVWGSFSHLKTSKQELDFKVNRHFRLSPVSLNISDYKNPW